MKPNLTAKQLSFLYRGSSRPILQQIDITFESGSFWAVLGPNGSGKTTFLKLLAGILQPPLNTVFLGESKPLHEFDPKTLAKNIAYVPGFISTDFPISVQDFVMQGRYPHGRSWYGPSDRDKQMTHDALKEMGLLSVAQSQLGILSAGQKQLALLARALTQAPHFYLLDEVISNLDLHFQLQVFKLLKKLNEKGSTVIMVCHDLNLASEFCSSALWFQDGRIHRMGTIDDTFTSEDINHLYPGQELTVGKNPFSGKPKVFYSPSSVELASEGFCGTSGAPESGVSGTAASKSLGPPGKPMAEGG